MTTLFTLPKQSTFDTSGDPLPGSRLYFYETGTSTPKNTFSDVDGNTPHSNPVTADAYGVFAPIWLGSGLYRVRLVDEDGVTQWTVDGVGVDTDSAQYPIVAAETGLGLAEDDLTLDYPYGHIRRYGVLLDGSEQTSELQSAIDFCEASGVPISAAGMAGTVVINATITMTTLTGDLSNVTVSCPSTTISPAIRVGVTSSGPTRLRGHLKLPKVINSTKPASGWASQQTGIEFAEVYEGDFYVPHVKDFTTGVVMGGYSSGCAYNTLRIGQLENNKIGLKIGGQQTSGWANQNTIIGGRIFINTAEGTDISGARYVQLTPTADTSTGVDWPNSNTLIGLTLENDRPQYHAEIAGNNNLFINCRWEATTPTVLFTGHATNTETYENQIIGGSNVCDIAFTVSGRALYNGVASPRTWSQGGTGVCLNLKNETSSNAPLIQGFPATATEQHLNAGLGATEWTMRLASAAMTGKLATDTYARYSVLLTTGQTEWGGGSAATDVVLQRIAPGAVGFSTGTIALRDGMTAPTATSGYAKVYVDSADGDLKVRFGDGTIKTIVTDT